MDIFIELLPFLVTFILGGIMGLAKGSFSGGQMVQDTLGRIENIENDIQENIKPDITNMRKKTEKTDDKVASLNQKLEVSIVSMQKDIEFIKYAVTSGNVNKKKA